MKEITIEWRHLDVSGDTCDRCDQTGENLQAVLDDLNSECEPQGVKMRLREVHLTPERLEESNAIRINGIPIESLLAETTAGSSNCCSCGDLVGQPVECRTIESNGSVHEAVPGRLIREAVCRLAGCC